MKFYRAELKNGLKIIGEERPGAVSSALGFFVKTGARDETPAVAGVSHFLEHMMFKGTPKRTALEINFELASLGAQANAYTAEERTVYYAAVLPEYLIQALDLFSDMLRPSLLQEEFDVEKKVILEEIALYQDRPNFVLYEEALRTFFSGHVAGSSVLGSRESITLLSREQMLEYFLKRYVPSNMVLSVAGAFNWEEFLEKAEACCSAWQGPAALREVLPHKFTPSQKVIRKQNMQRAHVALLAPAPSLQEEDKYAAHVLSVILGDSLGSKVYWELIDKGLADSAAIDADDMDGVGVFMGYASTSANQLGQVTDILRKILHEAAEFSDEDLSCALAKIGTRVVLQGESSMRRLMSVGADWLEQEAYLTLEEELGRYRSVDRQALNRLLERYPLKEFTEVSLLPEV